MAATDSQIALTMTFTLRPPFKTHFLLLKDYVADVRIPARDGMLTTIIAKNIPLSPALEQLKRFLMMSKTQFTGAYDQAVQEFFSAHPEQRPVLPIDLLQVMLNTLSAQGLSDQQLMHIMKDVLNGYKPMTSTDRHHSEF